MTKLLLRLSLAVVTLATVSKAALAADYVPPPPPLWGGLYIGGNVGYAFSAKDEVSITSDVEGTVDDIDGLELHGILGGAQIGYDVQWEPNGVVLGVVADIQAADVQDDFKRNFVISGNNNQLRASGEIDLWGTIRGRLGWATDNVLIYGTGGAAWANVDYEIGADNFSTGGSGEIDSSDTRWGYAVGGGLEWAIDASWSIGAEYLYVNLGDYEIDGPADDGAGNPEVLTTDAEPDFHSVKAFVNFRIW